MVAREGVRSGPPDLVTGPRDETVDAEMPTAGLGRRRRLRYYAVAVAITIWAALIVTMAAAWIPVDHYLISYYIADYTFGFVRRGLAGELVGNVADPDFFSNAITMRWITTTAYLVALAALAFAVLRRGLTERRVMLALLIPVLPFGVPYAVYSARPDLLGATVLIGLILALGSARRPRAAVLACAAFGMVTGVLSLVHEGIIFELALGAILGILVLTPSLTPSLQRWCGVLAVLPGVIGALMVATFAERDVSERICARVPHTMLPNPLEGATTPGQVVDNIFGDGGGAFDYHDWVCGWYLSTYDYGITDGIREVLGIGVAGLVASFALGLVIIAVTVVTLRRFSGVPLGGVVDRVRGPNLVGVVAGLVLMVPLFMTAIDWTRWLLVIAFNIAIVYLMYIRDRPELDETPSRRAAVVFPLVVAAFALIPVGLVPGGTVS